MRLTITELAKAAGVSTTTVSHAFSGKRPVETETRERILALAAEMGYSADPRARRLRTGSAGIIALASSMPFSVAAGPSRLGFLMEIAAAAAMTALSRNLALCLVPPLQPGFDLSPIEVDGVIMVEPLADDPLVAFFHNRGIPVVAIGKQPGAANLPFIDMQSTATARLLLDHLWCPGGRIGLITGDQRRNSYLETEAAYAAFAEEKGFHPAALRIDEAAGEEGGRMAAERLLAANPDLDALCVPVDAFATGALKAAAGLGRRIPQDLRIATRYDGMRAKLAQPQLTAVTLHLDNLAEAAVDLLNALFEGREISANALPRPEIVVRGSSREEMAPEAHLHHEGEPPA